MRSPRYTILVANRKTGAVKRLTVSRRLAAIVLGGVLSAPVIVGLGSWNADTAQVAALQDANDTLLQENQSYRAATGELTAQIGSLQTALTELGEQAQLDPATKLALDKLARVRPLSMGGPTGAEVAAAKSGVSATPERTFGILRDLLGSLEVRLQSVKTQIETRQAYGNRKDPFTGLTEFHPGLDISAQPGVPVHATADGTVQSAFFDGNYGNAVLIDHGFGISTRYGHLSRFAVRPGQAVKRNDVIGYVGATGRVTGPHLHYEILVGGSRINPITLLSAR
jgi:murein DD-endopeptidase MepM/ murein hydrolase activator NlpD